MSFINKFIDKAKGSKHNNQQQQQQQQQETAQKESSSHQSLASSQQNQNASSRDGRKEEGTILSKIRKLQISNSLSANASSISSDSSLESNYAQQQTRNTRLVYNDQHIIRQRQDRPRLKLADFHIQRTLGTGSFGRVHLVQSRVNHRFYAIKVLKKSEVVRLKQVEHTNNEKHILESVAHPFLVNMWGTFQDSVNLYMVMDYVPGGELFSVLRRSKVYKGI